MRIYYYFGLNRKLKSGISMKIWKITRPGRTVYAEWGAAISDKKTRRAKPTAKLRKQKWSHPTEAKAELFLKRRIASKLYRGYEPAPRRRG
jgi:hypothetical protein